MVGFYSASSAGPATFETWRGWLGRVRKAGAAPRGSEVAVAGCVSLRAWVLGWSRG